MTARQPFDFMSRMFEGYCPPALLTKPFIRPGPLSDDRRDGQADRLVVANVADLTLRDSAILGDFVFSFCQFIWIATDESNLCA